MKSKSLRSFAAWLALLAVTLNAFWPLMAHARPAGAAALLEVCTSEGMKLMPSGGAEGGQSAPAEHKAPHCPFCMSPGGIAVAPPPAVAVFVLAPFPLTLPRIGHTHFQSFDAREHASPRAPPRYS